MYYAMNFQLPDRRKVYENQQVKRYFSGPIKNDYNPKLVELVDRMYRDNPNDRPSASEALKELESIKKIDNNNINMNINNINYFNISLDNKVISSMKCILYFFYGIDNMTLIKTIVNNKLKNIQMPNNNFALSFFNMYDIVDKKRKNQINNIQFNDNIRFFINQLLARKPSINGIRPVILYHSLLSLFKEDFGQSRWENKIGPINYGIINGFPPNMFPYIYSSINEYVATYKNPLIDILYFIFLISEKCPNCNYIFNAYARFASFISLDNVQPTNIMTLIKNKLGRNFINQFIQCNCCGYRGNLIEEKYFFNTPDYLVLDLDEGEKVNFDFEINLSEYIKTNIGPKKYELYAVINREIDFNNNLQFIISIKEKGQWIFCSGDNIEKCGSESISVGIPSCAIYKKAKS